MSVNLKARIVINGCYGNRNYGDLLMVRLLSEYIARRHLNRVTCLWMHSKERESTAACAHGGLAACWNASAAILWGGGYLESSSSASTKRLMRYLIPAKIWSARNIPYVIAGVGVGAQLRGVSPKLIKSICNGAVAISVRDPESRDILASIGVETDNMCVTADVVLGLRAKDIPEQAWPAARALLPADVLKKRIFGLHLPLGRALAPLHRQIIELVAQTFPQGSETAVVWIEDSPAYSEYHKMLARKLMPWAVVVPNQSPWVTAALIGTMTSVMTTKLHVGITAWALGVAPCALSLHEKTGRFFKQIDRADYQMPIEGGIAANHKVKRAMTRLGLTKQTKLSPHNIHRLKSWLVEIRDIEPSFFRDNLELRERITESARSNYNIVDKLLYQGCVQ